LRVNGDGKGPFAEEVLAPGTLAEYHVPVSDVAGNGRVAFIRMLESPMAARFVAGLVDEIAATPVRAALAGAERVA
jgi:hypothetical protein